MNYYIYVLKSLKDNNLYIGCTSNLKKRLDYHHKGNVKSTKHRRPLNLIYSEKYNNKYEAYKKERYYKTAKGKKELKNKIKHYSNKNRSGVV
ncbi:GIY-YIG nuclease family protein [Patescibacteria group bacterium]|nr:GIY-YIG nuclease family protein [Patescibacteria group bacterium]MBU4481596.1 GIY-YIG nuclease family protein [Patescibacteria group bacterium]